MCCTNVPDKGRSDLQNLYVVSKGELHQLSVSLYLQQCYRWCRRYSPTTLSNTPIARRPSVTPSACANTEYRWTTFTVIAMFLFLLKINSISSAIFSTLVLGSFHFVRFHTMDPLGKVDVPERTKPPVSIKMFRTSVG